MIRTLVCVFLLSAFALASVPAIHKDTVFAVNSNSRSTWRAGYNQYFADQTIDDARVLMGFKPTGNTQLKTVNTVAEFIPISFNSTAQWPKCTTISTIYNQAKCGSCWAFGCVEAVSDRFCIHQGVSMNFALSFMEQTTCNDYCDGCDGGDPDDAWGFAQSPGLVSDSCYPYTIPTCLPSQQPCLNFTTTPSCESSCNSSKEAWTPYPLSTAYDVGSNETAIQTEIMTNGPVEACFDVYSDFLAYKSGVYSHQTGELLGGHCIKIIGWGVENGTPYWDCNNSWTTSWGDSGQFKILRGSDECGIEDEVVAGMP